MLKGLINKVVAGAVAAAAGLVAVIFLGITVYHLLFLVLPPAGASALTFALFAAMAAIVAVVFLKKDAGDHHDEDEEPEGLAAKALHLIKDRPMIGAVGGLGALFLLLRNPALAAIVASFVTERKMERRGYRRRR
ncbi:hypothetical protein [uncultured Brevundimonas sp.]|uniref:hypothetical protein n=1 Tax=uncultured Brevundimonas sp. TaxID=213418 RepID=UPI0025F9A4D8|nr:hypothetical protein [uncultured Brevundimonas sp.]